MTAGPPEQTAEASAIPLDAPELYLNRELSWLEFNRRVLSLSRRDDVPALERLKFIAITASNLEEFFMVRVGGLERQARRRETVFEAGPDGLRLSELLREVWSRARELSEELASALVDDVIPELKTHGVRFLSAADLEGDEDLKAEVHRYYQAEVHPCLTPIAIDPVHPFPTLRSGSVNIALRIGAVVGRHKRGHFDPPDGELLALVQVPSVLPRFVVIPGIDVRYRFMSLEDVIAQFVEELFPGHRILEASAFRVTRASDLDIAEDEADDLLSTIQDELRRRDRGEAVRLELTASTSPELEESLREMIGVKPRQVLRTRGNVAMSALMQVYGRVAMPRLRDEPFNPAPAERLRYAPTLFRSIAERDILLHHPYESFRHVIDLLEQAALDPDVVAIKQTLYRTSGDSPIVRALARAAEKGKQVTALVELKARFDEANNIAWAKKLEDAGAHVVYGLIGLKTHCKMLLVTRREGEGLKRYLHLSTGNYNPNTARLYTDIGLFTTRDDLTHDAMLLFNVLTGYADLPKMQHLVVAPFTLRQHTLDNIRREAEHARAGRPSGIVAKMNSLVDGEIIRELYAASRAGVRIDLVVRGICCLRPGVPGVSENIRVRSLLDRFLEHSRIFWWKNGGQDQVYLSSADWMPRNLNRRIEVAFPVLDQALAKRVMEEILPIELADNTFGWEMGSDGDYRQLVPGDRAPLRAQLELMKLARGRTSSTITNVRPEVPVKPSRVSPVLRVVQAAQRKRRRNR